MLTSSYLEAFKKRTYWLALKSTQGTTRAPGYLIATKNTQSSSVDKFTGDVRVKARTQVSRPLMCQTAEPSAFHGTRGFTLNANVSYRDGRKAPNSLAHGT